MKVSTVEHRFVEFLPGELKNGVLYVSMPYAIAEHLCCCGCGQKVVTPLTPTDWSLTFDGTVSLRPSIGNWSFPCQSHYWIRDSEVVWAPRWSRERIEAGRAQGRRRKDAHYAGEDEVPMEEPDGRAAPESVWDRLQSRFRRWIR